MKIKKIIILATLTALFCCKSETNVKNTRQNVASIKTKDSSKQQKIVVVKNNEYFLLNDRRND